MNSTRSWVVLLGCFLVTGCYSNTWGELFTSSLFRPQGAVVDIHDGECGVEDVPDPEGGSGGAPTGTSVASVEGSSSAAESGSGSSASASDSSSSSGSGTSTGCTTCEDALSWFRDMQGPLDNFCTNPNSELVWKLVLGCLCDPHQGGCSDACGPYCAGTAGPVPAGSACDACTRDHSGECGPVLNACTQASLPP